MYVVGRSSLLERWDPKKKKAVGNDRLMKMELYGSVRL